MDCSCDHCRVNIFSTSVNNILSINDHNGERKKTNEESIKIIQSDIERLKVKFNNLKNQLLRRIEEIESKLKTINLE